MAEESDMGNKVLVIELKRHQERHGKSQEVECQVERQNYQVILFGWNLLSGRHGSAWKRCTDFKRQQTSRG